MLNLNNIRSQFPILHQEVNGKPLIYFDNAATTQKPKRVIDALQKYYTLDNANIHRAAHTLASRSTEYFEDTRKAIQQFINAREEAECIFTKGVTESINLVPVNGEMRIIYKFGNESSDDENLIVLEPDAYEIDVAAPFYELLVISLPTRVLHPEGGCNEEMMELYNSLIINAGEPDDIDDEEWDDEEWDDEDWEDDDENDLEDSDEGDDTPDDDKPIDPRWAALKNLN